MWTSDCSKALIAIAAGTKEEEAGVLSEQADCYYPWTTVQGREEQGCCSHHHGDSQQIET